MEFQAKDKYLNMLSALSKLEKINQEKIGTMSNTDAKDATEIFFSQCYHLKDWLKKEYPDISRAIENYINECEALPLAGDYTNSFKHGGLIGKSRSGKNIEKINTHIDISFFANKPRGISSSLEIKIDSQKYNSLELASKCVEEWKIFLKLNNIDYTNN